MTVRKTGSTGKDSGQCLSMAKQPGGAPGGQPALLAAASRMAEKRDIAAIDLDPAGKAVH